MLKPVATFSVIAFVCLALNIPNLSFDKFIISFSYLLRWLAYTSLYFIIKDFDNKFKKKIGYLMIFSGFVVVLLGFVQYFLYPNLRNLYYLGWDEHFIDCFQAFFDPNFAGAFFAVFFVYTLNFFKEFFRKKTIGLVLLCCLVSVSTLIALYLTYSEVH